ncbi:MAG TPA: YybS family protein [Geobacteraceae bacterium]
MNLPDKGALLDILKGGTATLALYLASISLPLAGVLPGVFSPLPAIYYGLKNGRSAALAIVLLTTALLAFIAGPTGALVFMAQSGLIAIAFPFLLGRGWGAGRAMVGSVAVAFCSILIVAAIYWATQGIDPSKTVRGWIDSGMSQSSALYEKSGITGEELKTLQQGVKEAGNLIARIYPALVLAGLGAIAGFNLLALKGIAARLGRMSPVGDFRRFRNPDHLIWLLIVAGFALLINNDVVSTAALNLLAVLLPLYFLQGLAIIIHYLDQFRVNWLFRVIFFVLLAIQPYLLIAVAVFGIFDLWGNFRTPKKRENL